MADPCRPVIGYPDPPNAAANGYPYPATGLPQNYDYDQSAFLRRVMIAFLVISASVVFIVWLVLRLVSPNSPSNPSHVGLSGLTTVAMIWP